MSDAIEFTHIIGQLSDAGISEDDIIIMIIVNDGEICLDTIMKHGYKTLFMNIYSYLLEKGYTISAFIESSIKNKSIDMTVMLMDLFGTENMHLLNEILCYTLSHWSDMILEEIFYKFFMHDEYKVRKVMVFASNNNYQKLLFICGNHWMKIYQETQENPSIKLLQQLSLYTVPGENGPLSYASYNNILYEIDDPQEEKNITYCESLEGYKKAYRIHQRLSHNEDQYLIFSQSNTLPEPNVVRHEKDIVIYMAHFLSRIQKIYLAHNMNILGRRDISTCIFETYGILPSQYFKVFQEQPPYDVKALNFDIEEGMKV